jgi:hypothetical protein
MPRITHLGGFDEEPTIYLGQSQRQLRCKGLPPTPYSEAQLDPNATSATPLARRAAVRLKTAADSLAATTASTTPPP